MGCGFAIHARRRQAARGHSIRSPLLRARARPLEVANTLLVLCRRRKISPEERASACSLLARFRPVLDEEGSRLALSRLSELADEHSLTIYDAAYLELAIRRKLPLASRDSALNKAAQRCGLDVLL